MSANEELSADFTDAAAFNAGKLKAGVEVVSGVMALSALG
jgi:hypothetical protein